MQNNTKTIKQPPLWPGKDRKSPLLSAFFAAEGLQVAGFYYFCGRKYNNPSMESKKILLIAQEMTPYTAECAMSQIGHKLPVAVSEKGCDVRPFMPRWGSINERRNQLHEVIRLSGMNIVIDDTDHPLIIKVASLQGTRMQVYFIDSDDYFNKRLMTLGASGEEYGDNMERAVFYARGVLETVKKLRWVPDVIHCVGWMSAIVPLYVKTAYCDEPTCHDTKVVFTPYGKMPPSKPIEHFLEGVAFRSADKALLESTGLDFSQPEALCQLGALYCDGYVKSFKADNPELFEFAKAHGKAVLELAPDAKIGEAYTDFYRQLCGK